MSVREILEKSRKAQKATEGWLRGPSLRNQYPGLFVVCVGASIAGEGRPLLPAFHPIFPA